MKRLSPPLALAAGLFLLALGAARAMDTSAPETVGDLTISNGWARATIGPGTVSAAYFTIENAGGEADTLIGADSPAAAATEVHTTTMSGGIMRMSRIEELVIPAASTVALEPGGHHIMLIDLDEPLGPGDEVELTLTFEIAGDVTVFLPVFAGQGGH